MTAQPFFSVPSSAARPAAASRSRAIRLAAISAALVIVTLAAFRGVLSSEFVNYDDDRYVTENVHVRQGLHGEGIVWAFTSTNEANWHPLTWLSHMLDVQLFGEESLRLRPDNAVGRYNFANLLITRGRLDEAAALLTESLRLRPDFAEAHNSLGVVLMRQGHMSEAASQFTEVLRLRPDLEGVRKNLETARASQ